MRMAVAVAIALSAVMAPASFAGIESDPNLAKLEVKFFQKDYPKEEVDARLERLEKMIFGEAKTGAAADRLKNLVAAVPNLDSVSIASNSSGSGSSTTPTGSSSRSRSSADDAQGSDYSSTPTASKPYQPDPEESIEDSSSYPAVTAIEKRMFGRDYASEPIHKRLDRLEIKAFGKVTGETDLSARMDAIKAKTGVDVAKTPPPGSDWAEDDEGFVPGNGLTYHNADTQPYTSPPGEDGRSFSGRDLRSDMQKAFGRPSYSDPYSGSGSFGMGGGSRSSSGYQAGGSYGFTPSTPSTPPRTSTAGGGVPQPAPDFARGSSATAPPTAMGLSQQVSMLENELFRRTFQNETIPNRLQRLESTVFPGTPSAASMSLPDRVQKLLAAVPVAPQAVPDAGQRSVASRQQDDFDFDDDMNGNVPRPAPQRTQGGLSKIINGLGNMLGGGFAGSYNMSGANLVRDPQTGMLFDRFTGNIIDPMTGVVVGQRSIGGLGGVGSMMGGFNNGFTPMGTPYGGSNMRFGFGSGGMGFGSGMGFGGMGFGPSMGGIGIGWP